MVLTYEFAHGLSKSILKTTWTL